MPNKSYANNLKIDPHFLEKVKSNNIKMFQLWLPDLDGIIRGKIISKDKIINSLSNGISFSNVLYGWDMHDFVFGDSIFSNWNEGFKDARLKIFLDSFRLSHIYNNTAIIFSDYINIDDSLLMLSPRNQLIKAVKDAKLLGIIPIGSVEYEFGIYKKEGSNEISGVQNITNQRSMNFIQNSGYSIIELDKNSKLIDEILLALERSKIEIESFHTESGEGAFECSLKYKDFMSAADDAIHFKHIVKNVCEQNGLVACFMAKPDYNFPGAGAHIHQSLRDLTGKKNKFFNKNDELNMSEDFKNYIAGILEHLDKLSILIHPNINSFKRVQDNSWAPANVTWGIDNRTTAIRVINNSHDSTRMEFRVPGADHNVYLGFALSLNLGLRGIKDKIILKEKVDGNGYEYNLANNLPNNFSDAITSLDKSKIGRELFGAEFIDHFVLSRYHELKLFNEYVTDWEKQRYFKIV